MFLVCQPELISVVSSASKNDSDKSIDDLAKVNEDYSIILQCLKDALQTNAAMNERYWSSIEYT